MLLTISELTFLKNFGKHCDFKQTQSTQSSTACSKSLLRLAVWTELPGSCMVLTMGCCWRMLISKSPCSQNSAATSRATYIDTEEKRKLAPITWCASRLHSETNLISYPSVSCPTTASLFLLGRADVAIGLHLSSDSSAVLLPWISLGCCSSIGKHFHLVGVYLIFYFLLSFLHAEQEGRLYFFTLL